MCRSRNRAGMIVTSRLPSSSSADQPSSSAAARLTAAMRLAASAPTCGSAERRTSSSNVSDAGAGMGWSMACSAQGVGNRRADCRAISSQTHRRTAVISGSDGGVSSLPATAITVARASTSRRMGNHGTASLGSSRSMSAVVAPESRARNRPAAASANAASARAANGAPPSSVSSNVRSVASRSRASACCCHAQYNVFDRVGMDAARPFRRPRRLAEPKPDPFAVVLEGLDPELVGEQLDHLHAAPGARVVVVLPPDRQLGIPVDDLDPDPLGCRVDGDHEVGVRVDDAVGDQLGGQQGGGVGEVLGVRAREHIRDETACGARAVRGRRKREPPLHPDGHPLILR